MDCLSLLLKGELMNCRIGGRILQLDTVTQSESTRRRYRYLSHFSLTTAFQVLIDHLLFFCPSKLSSILWKVVCSLFRFTLLTQLCEIDLTGILPSDSLLPFMDEIKKREKERKQLAKKVWCFSPSRMNPS